MISGYIIHKPTTVKVHQLSRLVLLAREGLEIKIVEELMNTAVASIWVRITMKGMKPLLTGGVYREHQYLHQATDQSLQPGEQLARWKVVPESGGSCQKI